MKVFITWSGERAKTVAEAIREWLPAAIQSVEPWVSERDIRAGGRWLADLNEQLDQTDFGIVVLTPESLDAPWIHYESGALAKKVETGAVCPYLVDINEKTIVTGPLAQFQSKLANERETFDLSKAINQRVEGRKLDDARLKDSFTKLFWPRLDDTLSNLPSTPAQPTERRPGDLLKEILERVRSLERQFESGSLEREHESELRQRELKLRRLELVQRERDVMQREDERLAREEMLREEQIALHERLDRARRRE